MGAWGVEIFEDDAACEVRDAFMSRVAMGLTAEAATAELEREWGSPFDPDDEPVFWIALATAQRQAGLLTQRVRDRALAVIDDGSDLNRGFLQPEMRQRRSDVLGRLKADLVASHREVLKAPTIQHHETSLRIGELLSYRLPSARLCLWRVVRHHVDKGGRFAVVEVLPRPRIRLPGELEAAMTAAARDHRTGKAFEMMLMPWHEASDQLSRTSLGRSGLARLLNALRRSATSAPGSVLCITPMGAGLDGALADHLLMI